MPYANKGITPNGRTFYRTDGVLCQDGGLTLSGFIAEIDVPGSLEGDEVKVSIALLTGFRATLDTDQSELAPKDGIPQMIRVPWAYHQSTKIRRGEDQKPPSPLFCFKDEEPNWTQTQATSPAPQVQPAPEPEAAQPLVDPADTNEDGVVSNKERKRAERNG